MLKIEDRLSKRNA